MNKAILLSIVLATLMASAALTSCNIIAGVTYLASSDPEKEAEFELPDQKAVVFVDDRRNVMHPTSLRRVIAEKVTNELLTKEILTTIVSPIDVMRASAVNDRHDAPLSVADLGRSVDASIVIYIEMVAFGLTSDGQTASPRASCSVRVIDVENKVRLFPLEQAAFPISASMSRVDPHRIASGAAINKLAAELASELGDSIAKLFYTHNIGRLGENLNRK